MRTTHWWFAFALGIMVAGVVICSRVAPGQIEVYHGDHTFVERFPWGDK
jgi:hypothetical protein